MSYNSVEFFGFILSVFVVYFIVPKSIKWVVLLIASYVYYYFAAGLSMMSYLLITTISVFLVGYFMGVIDSAVKLKIEKIVDNENRRDRSKSLRKKAKQRKKLVLIVGIFINIGILAFLKYSGFVILNLNDIFSLNITSLDLLLPLGLSFYTFQATGYIIDVYRGKVAPDRNIAKFALFVSFFPQIVQGPISRYSDLAKQLYEPHSFDVTRIKYGAQLIMWGMFKKLVIADRAAFLVQYMLANADTVTGFEVLMGALGYTFQLYADFSGGIDIVIGIAQILGITLTPNFKRPYFSVSLADYWRRWHITLGAWMRDYVFYSIAMSKGFGKFISRSKKIFGQQFGLLLPSVLLMGFIFLLIGIWHGAEWKYIFYGLYNSVIIMAGMIFTPILTKANDRFHLVDTTAFSWRVLLTAMTFCLIVIGRIITVSHGLHQGLHLVKAMVTTFNPWIIFDGTLYTLGLDKPDLVVLCFAIGILIIVSILQESGMKVRETLDRQNLWFRWFICISAILVILVFGVYGDLDFASSEFIYQQF